MPDPADATSNAAARRRWALYSLLIAITLGQVTGRLLAVTSVNVAQVEQSRIKQRAASYRAELEAESLDQDEVERLVAEKRRELRQKIRLQRPFLSSNDRSRWLTIRALVEHGTYAIDEVTAEPGWDSIDMVKHPDRSGTPRLYSSKPPLLPTLLAGEYWLIHKATGATLGTHPYAIGRAMLATINLTALGLMLALAAAVVERLFDRWGVDEDWPRLLVVAAGAFGTMLLPFAVVLNNHLIGAASASVALYAWARIRLEGDTRFRWFVLAGFAAAFTAANELPALAFLVFLGGLLGLRHPAATLRGLVPAAAVIVSAFFATNYIAHDTLRPPYMHRSETDPTDNWYRFTYIRDGRERQSYWSQPGGMDRGEPSRATYALHALVGHHGVFSLTPMWLLSAAGALALLARGRAAERELAALVLALSIICLTFYIGFRPQQDRNYGGMTSGFRWMFWFTPLWLAMMAPAAAWCGRWRATRWLAGLLVGLSAMSAAYPTWNPWTQPWIYRWLEAMGWQGF